MHTFDQGYLIAWHPQRRFLRKFQGTQCHPIETRAERWRHFRYPFESKCRGRLVLDSLDLRGVLDSEKCVAIAK